MSLWFTHGMPENEAYSDRLELKFDGPDVVDHTIDVRDLAPSLLALSDLYNAAHRLVGDGVSLPPALDVRAHDEGSFAVDMILYFKDAGEGAGGLLSKPGVVATVTGLQLIEYVQHALRWSLLRHKNGRQTESVSPSPTPGNIRVRWASGDEIECSEGAQALVQSMDFNRTAGRVFEPVRKPGIDAIDLRRASEPQSSRVRIKTEDLAAFNTLESDDEIVSDNTREVVLTLDNLAFKPGNKWKVHDGTSSFWAAVSDIEFLQRFVDGKEAFAAGDSLRVTLRDVQLRSPDRAMWVEHSIERVIEHRQQERDTPLE